MPTRGHALERTRVSLFLPLDSLSHVKAFRKVVAFLKKQRTAPHVPVTGFTHSQFPDAVLVGTWWSTKRKQWDVEKVVLVLIDFQLGLEHPELAKSLEKLKKQILKSYQNAGSPQDEVWINVQRLSRLT